MENQKLNNGERGEKKKKTKKASLDGVTCPVFVHWGLINVRRKPENPESDSWGQASWQEE